MKDSFMQGTYSVVSSSGVVGVSLNTVARLQVIIANKFTGRFVVVSKLFGLV
jgi:hypothetical protein